jgi:uncharacterized protein
MKELLARFGWWRVTALALLLLPLALLPLLGLLWLWQSEARWVWFGTLLALAVAAWSLQRLAAAREARALDAARTQPDGAWPAEAEACWEQVEQFAAGASLEEWPLEDGAGLGRLARQVLALVAAHFHPRAPAPLLEMTLPHTLLIIERAARELRITVMENLPLSHRVTLGTMVQANTLRVTYQQYKGLLRLARAVAAPQSLVTGAVTDAVLGQVFAHGSVQVKTWLLREAIRKLGFHAIELYGGLARLDEDLPLEAATSGSRTAAAAAAAIEAGSREPLRILVLGRANAGKSSLINALFGELKAAADVLPDTTTDLVPYRLERAGTLEALVFDSPGIDGAAGDPAALAGAAREADLLLWVSAVDRPDRAAERAALERLRAALAAPELRPPPLLVAASHIDRLRPVREWQPPYVLDPPTGAKAEQIAAALGALARDLEVPLARIVPVCLAPGRVYNVADALVAAIMREQPEANRVRLLRCLRARRGEENWELLWRQLRNAGRLLGSLAQRS